MEKDITKGSFKVQKSAVSMFSVVSFKASLEKFNKRHLYSFDSDSKGERQE